MGWAVALMPVALCQELHTVLSCSSVALATVPLLMIAEPLHASDLYVILRIAAML